MLRYGTVDRGKRTPTMTVTLPPTFPDISSSVILNNLLHRGVRPSRKNHGTQNNNGGDKRDFRPAAARRAKDLEVEDAGEQHRGHDAEQRADERHQVAEEGHRERDDDRGDDQQSPDQHADGPTTLAAAAGGEQLLLHCR
uniref:Uncharacterized protein n=1 Tax=Zea mays TaxID=4577 RepID=A0A804MF48_MAIZE